MSQPVKAATPRVVVAVHVLDSAAPAVPVPPVMVKVTAVLSVVSTAPVPSSMLTVGCGVSAPPPAPFPGCVVKTMCVAVAADACDMGSATTDATVTNAARPTASRRSEIPFIHNLPHWVQAGR
jgi:hypothetical protein